LRAVPLVCIKVDIPVRHWRTDIPHTVGFDVLRRIQLVLIKRVIGRVVSSGRTGGVTGGVSEW